MTSKLRAQVEAIRASYWFVPAVMACCAVLLGVGVIWLDVWLGSSWFEGISWYQQIRADGAREVLSTIAGSMITVAGVVFSITLVALSYASSQYGPRVLTNFMTDRGNTVTLGTFIATFLYCLVVLRTIRGGDQGFVPQISIIIALLLAACSIGVLIFFIHHVLQTIHISNVVARIGEQLLREAATRFPPLTGAKSQEEAVALPWVDGAVAIVTATKTGYIRSIDSDALLAAAKDADLILRLRYRVGEFVTKGRGLADVLRAARFGANEADAVRATFTIGHRRTPEGDLLFLVNELVEVAARALSPGINDPLTAVTCLDWLGAAGSELAARELAGGSRDDENGILRIAAPPFNFEHFLQAGFGQLRPYAAADVMAALHFLRVLGEIGAACCSPNQIDGLRREASLLVELSLGKLQAASARRVSKRGARLEVLFQKGPGRIDSAQSDWLLQRARPATT